MDYLDKAFKEYVKNPKGDIISQLAEGVRQIPYGVIGSRKGKDVYRKKKGTCSGKHDLLKELIVKKTKYYVREVLIEVTFDLDWLNKFNVSVPEKLREIVVKANGIKDYHNFLQIKNGEWKDLDVTWPKELAKLGFSTANYNTARMIPVEIGEYSAELKDALIRGLPLDAQENRQKFIKELSSWIETLRKKINN